MILENSLRQRGEARDAAQEKLAIHWLSVLTTERRQPSAQALLAYLMWRGQHEPLVRKDPSKALALVTVAAENASSGDRVWIDDYYQEIYCGIPASSRKKVMDGLVGSYRQQYGHPAVRPVDRSERSALGGFPVEAVRTCADGERIPSVRRQAQQGPGALSQSIQETSAPATPFARGSMGGGSPSKVEPAMGLIEAGTVNPRR